MKFEDEIDGRGAANVAHAMRFARSIEDDALRRQPLAERFQRSLEDNDRDVVRIRVRRISGAWLENAQMGVQAAQIGRLLVKDRLGCLLRS